jgi:hypothetical protein
MEDPVAMYISAIEQMASQAQIYLRHKDKPEQDDFVFPAALRPKQLINGNEQSRLGNAEMLGWYDETYWYLMPQAAFNRVADFYRKGMVVFPDTERGLRKKLIERGLSVPGADGRMAYQVWIGEESHWVLRIKLSANKQGDTILKSD